MPVIINPVRLDTNDPRAIEDFVNSRIVQIVEQVVDHQNEKSDELKDMVNEMRELFLSAFPDGDPTLHRQAHVLMMKAAANKLALWAGLGTAVWGFVQQNLLGLVGVIVTVISMIVTSYYKRRDDARRAAQWFVDHQGALYDWQGILGFIAWPIPDRAHRWACHEACAAALGHPSPSRTDPAALCETLLWRMS